MQLKDKYEKEIVPNSMKEFNLDNRLEVPKIKKIVVNAGIGPFRENKEAVESFADEMSNVVGQRMYPRKARLSEAGFKVRKGDVVGYAVTLRGKRLWAFLEKLVKVALPRVRDFRGLSIKAFDKKGNYSIGIKEHVIFPEVNPNTVKGIRSLQITLVMDTDNVDLSRALLEQLGVPFSREDK
ncbi:50S ribosomal protein L5 [Patescibacteria group bacterium]|nr:50S ribosomal protein L5 [Patescibacteria group bacterium]